MSRAEKFQNKRKRGTDWTTGEVHTHSHSISIANLAGASANDPITTFVDRVSQDNRRRYHGEMVVELPSPLKRAHQGLHDPAAASGSNSIHADDLELDADRYEMGFEGDDEGARVRAPRLPRVVKPSDPALHRFRDRRDACLSNMLHRDGCLHADPDVCRGCKKPTNPETEPAFRCQDCYGDDLLCCECMVGRHAENPLHWMEKWNGQYFEERCNLKALGLRVQLGHPPHQCCPEPMALHSHFVVLHTNGIHEVAVDACDCENKLLAGPVEEQMERVGWFPATDQNPRTCATFACLDLFLLSTHQAKTTMWDFYGMLEKLTKNAGGKPPNRYHAFIRMCREFQHLLMLKRAGRGHALSDVAGTKPGELAVLCPCCPDPAVNLPADWQNAAPEDQFLYILFLALDVCFRLKRRLVSSELKDPSLGSGWAYLVESVPYRQYLLTVTDQKEMSTCSGLAALDYANTKFSRGYSATGVGMGVCTRHEFVQPNGVGDLQKGERYANMDWIFACILRHKDARLFKIISYDIVCQWWVHLKERLKKLPPMARLVAAMTLMRFVIPKMHIHSHTLACQLLFSLNFTPGSAQTDGEGIERPWAHIGGVATSTREMGPGSREDVLNCHWGYWNWQKLLGLGERLRTRLDRARKEYASQLEGFTQFSVQQAERVPAWRAMVEAFEKDPKQKNPYEMTSKGLTEADVLLRLEEDEARRVEGGVPGIHSVSPSLFMAAGLEVEDQQRRVRVQVELKKAGTTAQKIDVIGLRRKLNQSIRRLRKLQATYTPTSIVALEQRRNVPENETAENTPLFLPSALPSDQRAVEPLRTLAVIEDSLCDAQCGTALMRLRTQLHVKSRLLTYKQLQSHHQGANTRARTIVTRNESKIRLHSEKYQMAWEAKRRLVGGDANEVGWCLLRKEDIRCMEDAEELSRGAEKRNAQEARRRRREDELRAAGELPALTSAEVAERAERGGGENVWQVSWIWTAAGTAGTDAELEEALRIEWAKAWGRTRRWNEETRLVVEEARRLPVSLESRATEWEKRVQAVPVGTAEWEERAQIVPMGTVAFDWAQGAIAYGLKQAAMYRDIAAVEEDELMGVDEGDEEAREDEDEIGFDDDEDELDDLRGDISDDEFILGGGEDDD
ncbi:hypothetical protein B0H13DRAFT_2336571 [Mycena leptocephala]|nr:hypothetical protein B0H13DRAFT_2336571 [Mycena leptocephala]